MGIAARRRAEMLFDSSRNSVEIVQQYYRLLGIEPADVPAARLVA